MNDEEIIKALECCIEDEDCSHCPSIKEMPYCSNDIMVGAINLIKRQQVEIERLNSDNDEKFNQWNMLTEKTKQHYADLYNEAKDILKAEAVKEFAERLKNKIKTECNPYGKPTFDYDTSIAIVRYIDNLAKEMVDNEKGESEATRKSVEEDNQ